MLGSSLSLTACRGLHVLFMSFVFCCVQLRVSFKKQELHTFNEKLRPLGFLVGSMLFIFLVFCFVCLRS